MVTIRDQSTFERVLECSSLAVASPSVTRLLELYRDERTSLRELGDLIALDPPLAGRLLKLANAPELSPGIPVDTLHEALPLFGLAPAFSLTLSALLYQQLAAVRPAGLDHRRFWQRAVLSAVAARELAQLRRYPLRDELFVAALVQELGTLVLHEVLREEYGRLAARARGDHALLAVAERERLGFDHAEVGAKLLEAWGLPPVLTEVVLYSHDGRAEDGSAYAFAGRLVRAAAALAELWLDAGDAEAAAKRAYEVAEGALALTFDEALELNERVRLVAPDVAELFSSKLIRANELDAFADTAREVLVGLSIQRSLLEEQQREAAQAEQLFDAVTGLLERGYFEEALAGKFHASELGGTPLTVIFCDLDRLDQVNTAHGTECGDAVLRAAGAELSASLRETDLVGRWGPAELVVVISGIARADSVSVAERLRARIAAIEVRAPSGALVRTTASLGIAESGARASYLELIGVAEAAMSAAKRAGGDRVVEAEGGPVDHPPVEHRWAV